MSALVLTLTAAAAPVNISLKTWGSFGPATPAELSFTPAVISGSVSTDGTLPLSNLGEFSLAAPTDLENFHGQTFTLHFQFAPELGVVGPVDFTGTLHGAVSDHSNGQLQIHFNPNDSQRVTFSNANGAGAFTLSLDNIKGLSGGGAATLTGNLSLGTIAIPTGTLLSQDTAPLLPNPEPASSVLAGTALILLSLWSRRRLLRGR